MHFGKKGDERTYNVAIEVNTKAIATVVIPALGLKTSGFWRKQDNPVKTDLLQSFVGKYLQAPYFSEFSEYLQNFIMDMRFEKKNC